jgi:hypothetical protein
MTQNRGNTLVRQTKRSFSRTLGKFSPLKPPFSGPKYWFRKTKFVLFEPDE